MNNDEYKIILNYISQLKKRFTTTTKNGSKRYTTFYILSAIDDVLDNLVNKGDDE